jgi:hypothetical protein
LLPEQIVLPVLLVNLFSILLLLVFQPFFVPP